jgi:hypothetical protein
MEVGQGPIGAVASNKKKSASIFIANITAILITSLTQLKSTNYEAYRRRRRSVERRIHEITLKCTQRLFRFSSAYCQGPLIFMGHAVA